MPLLSEELPLGMILGSNPCIRVGSKIEAALLLLYTKYLDMLRNLANNCLIFGVKNGWS